MEQYSNLNVHGKIKQKNGLNGAGEQGTESNDVVLYPTLTTRVPTPLPSVPTSAEAGKAIVVNSAGNGLEYGEAGKVDGVKLGSSSATAVTVTDKYAIIPKATDSALGVVQIGSNITLSSGTISISATNITSALGMTIETGDSLSNDASKIPSSHTVWKAIDELPEPMVFKGSLGTGGTITTLPTASSSNEGWVYKVITAGTYASQAAKVGDTFICANTGSNAYGWVLIPSGDEPSGTVTSVAAGTGLTTDQTNAGPITSSGTISLANTTVSAGSFGPTQTSATTLAYSETFKVPKYTVDAQGRLTASGDIQFTLPASDNTDAKVQQKGITSAGEYPILLKYNYGTSDVAANYVNFAKPSGAVPTIAPSTGVISAPGGFNGPLTGPVTGNLTGNVTGNCSGSAGSVAYTGITNNPFAAENVTLVDM